jgi:DNA-binding MarR family transcriptional regulator
MEINENTGLMLHKIGSMMERVSDSVLFSEYGIGYSQFKILFALSHHNGVQQKEIAQFLGQTEASISRQIKLLKISSIVTIKLGSDDKKKHLISLTSKGTELMQDAFATLNKFYMPILTTLTEKDQHELRRILGLVHASMVEVCMVNIKQSNN